eukprot:scaffold48120_cov20-Tisochrysis_lutea.AAC.1
MILCMVPGCAEMVELTELLQPSPDETQSRQEAVEEVADIVKSLWPTSQVTVFGITWSSQCEGVKEVSDIVKKEPVANPTSDCVWGFPLPQMSGCRITGILEQERLQSKRPTASQFVKRSEARELLVMRKQKGVVYIVVGDWRCGLSTQADDAHAIQYSSSDQTVSVANFEEGQSTEACRLAAQLWRSRSDSINNISQAQSLSIGARSVTMLDGSFHARI